MHGTFQTRLRRNLGVSLYLLAAAWGWLQVFHPLSGPLYLIWYASFCCLLTYWCIVDSRLLGRPILHSFYWQIFMLWWIGVPSYLVWSRRLRGLGLVLVHTLGLYVVCAAVYILAVYLAWTAALFRPN